MDKATEDRRRRATARTLIRIDDLKQQMARTPAEQKQAGMKDGRWIPKATRKRLEKQAK